MLLDLPTEVLDAILASCSTPELKALSITCIFLRRLALPHLYRHVTFSYEKHQGHDPKPVQSLFWTIFHYPERAPLVRCLQFTANRPALEWERLAPFDSLTQSCAKRLLISRNYHLTHKLGHMPQAGLPAAMGAAVALLLLALPNLLVADLSVRFQFRNEPLDTAFTASMLDHLITWPYQGQIAPPLETVKYFIDCTDTEPETLDNSFQDALWLFYFPHIKSITARMVEREAVFKWPLGAPHVVTHNVKNDAFRQDALE
ncbi:MAG: hypothetical protein LQ350_008117 [Teloschistes chrysophthalmus]|nr:MAG: hypothetical protein LQ350_008117 [Niorma chrysophthalma]